MGIIVFGYTFFFFLFYGRSLIRPFIRKEPTTDPDIRKREGIAIVLFIAIVVLTANLDRESHWFAFIVATIFGYVSNEDCESL